MHNTIFSFEASFSTKLNLKICRVNVSDEFLNKYAEIYRTCRVDSWLNIEFNVWCLKILLILSYFVLLNRS